MCLLMTGSAANIRNTLLNTKGLIEDIYMSNPDGLGAMYVNKVGLKISKVLPVSADDARYFIGQLPNDDRQLALHWRWKTHGDVDLTNCHPYEIQPGVSAMMHNGILKTGNAKDTTKSDTWHFVEDYLKQTQPETLHDDTFVYLLGKYIGDNRFAIMTDDGRLSVVNKQQGILHEDVWFSNTYAWTPELLIPSYVSKYRSYKAGSSWAGMQWDFDEDEVPFRDSYSPTSHVLGYPSGYTSTRLAALHESIAKSLDEYDVSQLAYHLSNEPDDTVDFIVDTYHLAVYHKVDVMKLSRREAEALDLWTEERAAPIVNYLDDHISGPQILAEALIYHCIWTPYTSEAQPELFPTDDAAAPEAPAPATLEEAMAALDNSLEAMTQALHAMDGEDKVPH